MDLPEPGLPIKTHSCISSSSIVSKFIEREIIIIFSPPIKPKLGIYIPMTVLNSVLCLFTFNYLTTIFVTQDQDTVEMLQEIVVQKLCLKFTE